MSLLIKLSPSSNTLPVRVRLAISSSAESVLSVIISLTMLSKVLSVLSFCLVLITVILFSLGAPQTWSVKFKTILPAPSVVLPGLTTCLWSSVLYTRFLSNPESSTKLLFLLLNHSTTKPPPISLISSSCMFRLTNSARLPILDSSVLHLLTSGALADSPYSIKHR